MAETSAPAINTTDHDRRTAAAQRTELETAFMSRAVEIALDEPDIRVGIEDFRLDRNLIRARIAEAEDEIWSRVSTERSNLRDALEELAPAVREMDGYEDPPLVRRLSLAAGFLIIGVTVHTIAAALTSLETVFTVLGRTFGWAATVAIVLLVLAAMGAAGALQNRYRSVFERALGLDDKHKKAASAGDALENALASVVADQAREVLNVEIQPSFEPRFTVTEAPGLRRLADPSLEVPTKARADLTRALEGLESGSIGISGPRGVGKTTLIRYFCEGRHLESARAEDFVGLFVSAPVRYEARDFVLHLFASVCERVIGRPRVEELRREGMWALRDRSREQGARALSFSAAALFLVGAAVFIVEGLGERPEGAAQAGTTLMLIGVAAAVTSFVVRQAPGLPGIRLPTAIGLQVMLALPGPYRRAARRTLDRLKPQPPTLEQRATSHLRDIKYQQTQSTGWTGGVTLPLSLTLGLDEKTTIAQAPLTLPEIIDTYADFVASLSEGRSVIIGIDELDKMESEAVAQRFLNDIKGVFGEGSSHYLVSVSEDAMSSFERRGLPLRDVFDSSFDQIVQIPYLEFSEAHELLRRRVVRLAMGFQCFCFCLSGGLPRDLVRFTRDLVERGRTTSDGDLESLVKAVVANEVEAKARAAVVATRQPFSTDEIEFFLAWLAPVSEDPGSPSSLRMLVASLGDPAAGQLSDSVPENDRPSQQSLRDMALELATFFYFAATLLEFFRNTLSEVELRRAIDTPSAPGSIDALARARQEFTTSAKTAWRRIAGFRDAHGLPPVDFPA